MSERRDRVGPHTRTLLRANPSRGGDAKLPVSASPMIGPSEIAGLPVWERMACTTPSSDLPLSNRIDVLHRKVCVELTDGL